jgi:hypothetical protein
VNKKATKYSNILETEMIHFPLSNYVKHYDKKAFQRLA